MASITITVPDDKVERVLSAFLGTFPKNPEYSDVGWVKKKLADYVREVVLQYEINEACKQVSANDIGVE